MFALFNLLSADHFLLVLSVHKLHEVRLLEVVGQDARCHSCVLLFHLDALLAVAQSGPVRVVESGLLPQQSRAARVVASALLEAVNCEQVSRAAMHREQVSLTALER